MDEILKIDNDDYKYIFSEDIEVAVKHFPSAIDTGDVFVSISLIINGLMKDPLFTNLFSTAVYDFTKFLISKSKTIIKGNKHGQKSININVQGTVIDKNETNINFDIRCKSENIIDIVDKLIKINQFIDNTKFKKVNVIYDHSKDE